MTRLTPTAACARRLALLAMLSLSVAYGQLHLIAGQPTPEYIETFAADLLKLNADGTLERVEELATPEEGMWWIEAAEEARRMVLLTAQHGSKIRVIDMDQGKVVKRCGQWPDVPGPESSHTQTWLVADRLGRFLVGRYMSRGDPDAVLQGMSLDANEPCEGSFRLLGAPELGAIYIQGLGGPATGIEGPIIPADGEGAVRTTLGPDRYYLGYSVPREYWSDLGGQYGHVLVNNSKLIVIYYSDKQRPGFHRTIAYDKANNIWSQVPLPGYPLIRAFGTTLAMSELVKLGPEAKSARAAKTNRREAASRNGFSQGLKFRGEESGGFIYPGRLHIYDVATKKRSTIVTNEEDSEVLLVDDDTIYYRVNDSLYSTPMGSSGFMPGQKIATDDRILDVHWAFMK